jgi:hypothetical protein
MPVTDLQIILALRPAIPERDLNRTSSRLIALRRRNIHTSTLSSMRSTKGLDRAGEKGLAPKTVGWL